MSERNTGKTSALPPNDPASPPRSDGPAPTQRIDATNDPTLTSPLQVSGNPDLEALFSTSADSGAEVSTSCSFDTRAIIWDGAVESITVTNRYYNFGTSDGSLISEGALSDVPRYASGPCAGHLKDCSFSSRTFAPDPGGPVESITAYGKFWNYRASTGELLLTGTLNVGRYLSGPCAGRADGTCVFDTRTITGPDGLESITAYGQYWNFRMTDFSLFATGDLLTVPRYAEGPCRGQAMGSCTFETRTVYPSFGQQMESITAYGKFFNYDANGNLWLAGNLTDVARYRNGPCKFARKQKVLVLNYNPTMNNGQFAHQRFGWNDPHLLATSYANDMREASNNSISYSIAQWIDLREFPKKTNGFQFSASTYEACISRKTGCDSGMIDYGAIAQQFQLCEQVEQGKIDEVWLFGGPYFGYFESTMAGNNGFWVNSQPQAIPCNKRFIYMGFNYERGVAEMLHNFGHRLESTMTRVFNTWSQGGPSPYAAFSGYDKLAAGGSGCGNTHFPPNANADYDYANPRPVSSTCSGWSDYPNGVAAASTTVTCQAWNCDHRMYMRWMFMNLPRGTGTHQGYHRNWWRYLIDFHETVL